MATTERMKKVLIAYCDGMEDDSLEALGEDIRNGGLAWFPEEFEAAIRTGEFTPARWEYFANVGLDDDDEELLAQYLRQVWSNAEPDRPYPAGP
jgi:hypothetical protein